MRLDIYGRFQLDIVRENGRWVAFRVDDGKRTRLPELVIPPDLDDGEIAQFLDDLYHEVSKPGQSVRVVTD
jgi:hypothetical protein